MGSNDILGTYGRQPKKVKTLSQSVEEARRNHGGVQRQRSAAVACTYDSLWELVGTGEFRSFFVRPGARGGFTWTIKAVLELPEGDAPVYMHGVVKHEEQVAAAVEYCLSRGDWREDKYHK